MNLLRRYWQEIILIVIYLLLRLPFLLQIPLFEDEAIHVGWGVEMSHNITKFYLPMSRGVSPLFSWVTSGAILILANPMIAGRVVSLVCGGISIIIFFKILHHIANKKTAFIFTCIYSLLPMTIVYNRLALLESMLVMFILLIAYSIYIYQNKRQNTSVNYLIFLTLAMLTKIIGIITAPVVIISSLIVHFSYRKLFKYLTYTILALLIFGVFFYPFRSPTSTFYGDYVFISFNPTIVFQHFKTNLFFTYHWLTAYFSLPLLILSGLGVLCGIRSKDNNFRYYTYILIGFGILIPYSANLFFPRHLLVLTPFIVISWLILYTFFESKNKLIGKLIIFIIFIILIKNDYLILSSPENNLVLAKEDIFQFYQDWTSGRKLPEVANYFDEQIKANGRIIIYTDETGLYYYGLPLYIKQENLIEMRRLPVKGDQLNTPQFVIANRYIPSGLNSIDEKIIQVSERHEVRIIRIK